MVVTADRCSKTQQDKKPALVLWFEDVEIGDVSLAGGKNASLGEMIQQFTPKGINVPAGFATTAYTYRYFIKQAGLETKLHQIFANLNVESVSNLRDSVLRSQSVVGVPPIEGTGAGVSPVVPKGYRKHKATVEGAIANQVFLGLYWLRCAHSTNEPTVTCDFFRDPALCVAVCSN